MKTFLIILNNFEGECIVYFDKDRVYTEELLQSLQANAKPDEVYSLLED